MKKNEIKLPKLKNTITQIKNSVNIFTSKLHIAEERTENGTKEIVHDAAEEI